MGQQWEDLPSRSPIWLSMGLRNIWAEGVTVYGPPASYSLPIAFNAGTLSRTGWKQTWMEHNYTVTALFSLHCSLTDNDESVWQPHVPIIKSFVRGFQSPLCLQTLHESLHYNKQLIVLGCDDTYWSYYFTYTSFKISFTYTVFNLYICFLSF